YFSTMGIPVLAGRAFNEQDKVQTIGLGLDRPGAKADSIMINETLARTYWPDQNPIGKLIGGQQVIGVVGDFKQQGIARPVNPEAFWNGIQRLMFISVRSSCDPRSLVAAARAQVQSVDKDQPISVVKTMDDYVSDALGESRFYTVALGAFSTISLLLAAAGIYGLISFWVAEGTKEIGLRMALGATRSGVLRAVICRAAPILIAGPAFGVAGSVALTRVISSYLYNVGPRDTVTFGAVTVLLTVVALAACFIPARRASRLDPLAALRCE
ncbi:MAG TPA: FtsX-like permease family protein, partial [Blastocatellia bacterium]|nr:FtsX-like permease family protein [Blastocatellia bacterium]